MNHTNDIGHRRITKGEQVRRNCRWHWAYGDSIKERHAAASLTAVKKARAEGIYCDD